MGNILYVILDKNFVDYIVKNNLNTTGTYKNPIDGEIIKMPTFYRNNGGEQYYEKSTDEKYYINSRIKNYKDQLEVLNLSIIESNYIEEGIKNNTLETSDDVYVIEYTHILNNNIDYILANNLYTIINLTTSELGINDICDKKSFSCRSNLFSLTAILKLIDIEHEKNKKRNNEFNAIEYILRQDNFTNNYYIKQSWIKYLYEKYSFHPKVSYMNIHFILEPGCSLNYLNTEFKYKKDRKKIYPKIVKSITSNVDRKCSVSILLRSKEFLTELFSYNTNIGIDLFVSYGFEHMYLLSKVPPTQETCKFLTFLLCSEYILPFRMNNRAFYMDKRIFENIVFEEDFKNITKENLKDIINLSNTFIECDDNIKSKYIELLHPDRVAIPEVASLVSCRLYRDNTVVSLKIMVSMLKNLKTISKEELYTYSDIITEAIIKYFANNTLYYSKELDTVIEDLINLVGREIYDISIDNAINRYIITPSRYNNLIRHLTEEKMELGLNNFVDKYLNLKTITNKKFINLYNKALLNNTI